LVSVCETKVTYVYSVTNYLIGLTAKKSWSDISKSPALVDKGLSTSSFGQYDKLLSNTGHSDQSTLDKDAQYRWDSGRSIFHEETIGSSMADWENAQPISLPSQPLRYMSPLERPQGSSASTPKLDSAQLSETTEHRSDWEALSICSEESDFTPNEVCKFNISYNAPCLTCWPSSNPALVLYGLVTCLKLPQRTI
jgi:hypothetical protein